MYLIRAIADLFYDGWDYFFSNSEKLQRQSDLNVWKIPFKQQFQSLLQILGANIATEDTFVLCYWFCLLTAVVAFGEALMEFVNVFSDQQYIPKTYWNREYRHIPIGYRRKARIIGAGLNIAVTLFFLYGFLNLRHPFIWPWVAINAIILGLESLFFIINAVDMRSINWCRAMSLSFLILRFMIVFEVMSTIGNLE